MKYFIGLSLISTLVAIPPYPADSLLISKEITLIKKIPLVPIAAWQRISYNTKLLNCQFYPSCSNYGATALKEYGFLMGGIIASDRINRCNPFAIKYHADLNLPYRDKDGRLIDPVTQQSTHSAKKSPFIAAFFSSIFPGLGKIYAGRTMDGVTGLWTMYLTSSSTYYSIKNQKYIVSPLLGIITAYVYFGEIYGAWRAVKYYQKPSKSAQIKSAL
tara:strand:+ start:6032 stop:6679 length:648 start_codon:yes stop_codon:yes gene_type:complete